MAAAAASCSSDVAGTTMAPQSSANCMTMAHTSGSTWSSTLSTHGAPANSPASPAAQPECAVPAIGWPPTKLSSSPNDFTWSQYGGLDARDVGQRGVRREVANVLEHDRQRRDGHRHDDQCARLRCALQGLLDVLGRVEAVGLGRLDALDGPVVAEHLAARPGRRAHDRAADQAETEHANGRFRHGFKGGT